MGGVFISYRREDAAGFAGRIYDRLSRRLGRERVFIDVDNIQPGLDFVEVLGEKVGACDALVAIIGRDWVSTADKDDKRRIDDPRDFVRIEIEAALDRGVRVIPVLVEGAAMPRLEDLPESLGKLSRRQGIEISHARFDTDIRKLTHALSLLEAELRQRAEAASRAEHEKREAAGAAERAQQERRPAEAGAARQADEVRRVQQEAEAERTREEREWREAAEAVEKAQRNAEAETPRPAEEERRARDAVGAERTATEAGEAIPGDPTNARATSGDAPDGAAHKATLASGGKSWRVAAAVAGLALVGAAVALLGHDARQGSATIVAPSLPTPPPSKVVAPAHTPPDAPVGLLGARNLSVDQLTPPSRALVGGASPEPQTGPRADLSRTSGAVAWIADRSHSIKIERSDFTQINRIGDAMVDLTIGGNRRIAVSKDGSYAIFAAAGYEESKARLARYEVDGTIAWSILVGTFTAVDIDWDGNVYALEHSRSGAILLKIDGRTGKTIAKADVRNPFDLVVDSANMLVWVGGSDIRLFDLDLNPKFTTSPVGWTIASLDAAPDGSLIAAEAEYRDGDIVRGTNQLLRITIDGKVETFLPLDFRPTAVRVDRNWRIWVGGQTNQIVRFDVKGGRKVTQIPFEQVAYLAIEPHTGVVWVATRGSRIVRFNPKGEVLNEASGFPPQDKAIGLAYR